MPAPPTLRQGRAAACSPGFAKRKHRYGDVILFFPGPSGGGIGYGFGGLLRGVAQAGAELQLLRQPFGTIGQRTVADQHHPVPAVQRKGGAAAHETFQHAHGRLAPSSMRGRPPRTKKLGAAPALNNPARPV